MVRLKFTIAIYILLTNLCSGQNDVRGLYLGSYFTYLSDGIILESSSDSVQLNQYYLNINLKYALNHKFRVGTEFILLLTSPEPVEDPFYITGFYVDYDVLRAKRSKLNLRLGIGISNLSFEGEYEPKKRGVINRILGISYEFRIGRRFWISGGYYNHFPFNKIPYKYSVAQPFLGVNIKL